jgi:hypothetical protein
MNADLLFKINSLFGNDRFGFAFLGEINDSITDSIIDINLQYLPSEYTLTQRRRLSLLIAESFQNLVRHNNFSNNDLTSFFYTRQRGINSKVGSINPISYEASRDIDQKLQDISKLSKEELHNKYVNVLSNTSFSAKGGANLGFIEMVRKTGKKISYRFDDVTSNILLFNLLLYFSGDLMSKNQNKDLAEARLLYDLLKSEHIFFIVKGSVKTEFQQNNTSIVVNVLQSVNARSAFIHKVQQALSFLYNQVLQISKNQNIAVKYVAAMKEIDSKQICLNLLFLFNKKTKSFEEIKFELEFEENWGILKKIPLKNNEQLLNSLAYKIIINNNGQN